MTNPSLQMMFFNITPGSVRVTKTNVALPSVLVLVQYEISSMLLDIGMLSASQYLCCMCNIHYFIKYRS